MKKTDIFKIKIFLYPIIEFAFVSISGFLISLVKEPYVGVALNCWCIILLITGALCIFLILLAEKRYLLKYFFLGKSFKKQTDEFFEENEVQIERIWSDQELEQGYLNN